MSTKPVIKYTDRDFESIRKSLIEHAKRFYPDRYNDFNDSSFGSLMFDAVSYVGDIMSFYLDYQVNESFLETALEYNNIRRLSAQMGYKFYGRPSAYGTATFYIVIPADATGEGPKTGYIPLLQKGSLFKSSSGASFILIEDVDFNNPNVEVAAATFDDYTGKTSNYALRSYGQVKSGVKFLTEISVGAAEKFLRIKVGPSIINEIESVYDSEGHQYYQVDNLSQDVVYLETINANVASDGVRSIMKPFVAARRFVVDQDDTGTYLQFGFGSDEEGNLNDISDPSTVVLKFAGKNYLTDSAFDPNELLKTDKFGIAPSNTTLKVTYGSNDSSDVSVAIGQLNSVNSAGLEYPNAQVDLITKSVIKASLEVSNDEVIAANTSMPTSDEMRYRAHASFAAQNRIVTRNDYEIYCYQMPPQFGAVKRASIVNDPGGTNRRLALYVVSEDKNGYLVQTNETIKLNLKTWLQKNKMINDGIDIYDTKIVNFGFSYEFVVDSQYNSLSVMADVDAKLRSLLAEKFYIGEPLYLNKIYSTINKTTGVVDTILVTPEIKSGGSYSSVSINIEDILSEDGSYIRAPNNVVLEIKFFDDDIKGTAV
jgi:hypothetical protein